MRRKVNCLLVFGLIAVLAGCRSPAPYDTNTVVPKGDTQFPPLGESWVIDKAGVLSEKTANQGDAICQGLQYDGLAEVVVVLINGVKHPVEWATHYGRWLKLGEKGLSTQGGNNGIVWLIRPDARDRMTISVGRGLPKFTSSDYGGIMDLAKDYINFGNYDRGVSVLISETDRTIRRIYGKKTDAPKEAER